MSHPVAGHASGNIAGGGGGYTDHRVQTQRTDTSCQYGLRTEREDTSGYK